MTEFFEQLDALINPWLDSVVAFQTAFYGINGFYWQGLETHSQMPANGVKVPADRLDLHPTDQFLSWEDLGQPLPEEWDVSVSIDVYGSPWGPGYAVEMHVVYQDQPYYRVQVYGPAAPYSEPWTESEIDLDDTE